MRQSCLTLATVAAWQVHQLKPQNFANLAWASLGVISSGKLPGESTGWSGGVRNAAPIGPAAVHDVGGCSGAPRCRVQSARGRQHRVGVGDCWSHPLASVRDFGHGGRAAHA
eukprot:gnl/TRDRNA2_/TRDRNA2_69835_c0_seq1.p2 gnl/TRDRNA2_/TRDRNA2_69835_c0~~gnl/TRDRNA2_/TRDRNA2_69835_c0_seq1.p2  ORF type:complete len:112 (-),score=8.52 gnl/TRDRNA2_/TRDRNA2_69835_c0_seq1:130-465(-)